MSKNSFSKFLLIVSVILLVFFMVILTAGAPKGKNQGPFDPNANARNQIEAAVHRAALQHQNVLLVFGANWCPWCRALEHLFLNNEQIHHYLQENYQLVLVDVGKGNKNLDLDSLYHHPVKMGLPALVVLDDQGNLLHLQETGVLETGNKEIKGHDPHKVLGFLEKWKHK